MSPKAKTTLLMIVGYNDRQHPTKLQVTYGGTASDEEAKVVEHAINELNETVVFPVARQYEGRLLTSEDIENAYARIDSSIRHDPWSWVDEVNVICAMRVWGTEP